MGLIVREKDGEQNVHDILPAPGRSRCLVLAKGIPSMKVDASNDSVSRDTIELLNWTMNAMYEYGE